MKRRKDYLLMGASSKSQISTNSHARETVGGNKLGLGLGRLSNTIGNARRGKAGTGLVSL